MWEFIFVIFAMFLILAFYDDIIANVMLKTMITGTQFFVAGKTPSAKLLSSYTIKLINLVMMMVIMTSPRKNIYKGKCFLFHCEGLWKIFGTLKHTQIYLSFVNTF